MKTLIIAPHPDDELLGCGGTSLRRVAEGGTVAWLLMTAITKEAGWAVEKIQQRAAEIERVREGLHVSLPITSMRLGFQLQNSTEFP